MPPQVVPRQPARARLALALLLFLSTGSSGAPVPTQEQLAETRNATLKVADRIQEIYEKHFPKNRREEGMTQAEFIVEGKALMVDLAADPLYTAGITARPGAMKPDYSSPWTRNFFVSEDRYFHLGWLRANKTVWAASPRAKTFGVSDWIHRRPQILGQWSDVPKECTDPSTWAGFNRSYYNPDHIDPDGPYVRLCKGTVPPGGPPRLPVTRHRVTLCIHKVLRTESSHRRFRSEWLEAYFRHYKALGVDHFYVYVSRIPFVDVPGYSYDWIDTSWMHGFSDNQYGQTWAMQDCVYRNREQKNQWSLFVDLDELASLPGLPGGLKALASALEARRYEFASFHSVGYLSSYCDLPYSAADGLNATERSLAERMIFRAPYPESCEDMIQDFVKIEAVSLMGIHSLGYVQPYEFPVLFHSRPGVTIDSFNPMLRALNGSRAWMKHVRGVGFEDVRGDAPQRVLCWGPPEGCLDIPAGIDCSNSGVRGGFGSVSEVNPSSVWVTDKPYEIRAAAQGDILAGSYEQESWGGALRRRRTLRRGGDAAAAAA